MSFSDQDRHRPFLRHSTSNEVAMWEYVRTLRRVRLGIMTRLRTPGDRDWSRVESLLGMGRMCLLLPFSFVFTLTSASAAPVDFVRDVRPIFEAHCYDCHSGDTRKSGLRLDLKAAALKGGDNHGPDIIPGKAGESPLIRFLTTGNEDEIMPQKGGPLSDKDIATITDWVNEGAHWPDGVDDVTLEDPADHWSFKPLTNPEVPGFKVQVSSPPKPSIEGQLDLQT